MGKTINIEGACNDEMIEDVDEYICQTCPFNARNEDSGCFMGFPDLIVDVLPRTKEEIGDDSTILYYYGIAGYAIERLAKIGSHASISFTSEETRAMFMFFSRWKPSDKERADRYHDYWLQISDIMRRAMLLGKGIVIGW